MEVEGNLEVPPPHTEETHEELSAQNLQFQWKNEETMHEEHLMHGGAPMQEELPMHERYSL